VAGAPQIAFLAPAFCAALCNMTAIAAPPAPTLNAFDRYAAIVEDRIGRDASTETFLRVLPDEAKRARVRSGEVLVESAQSLGVQPDIAIPNGQIQHWAGAAFLPNATLEGVLPRLRNYNNRSRYMRPEIVASQLMDRQGDVFRVHLRLLERSILSGVFDLNLRVVYRTPAAGRLAIESRSMSVVAVGKDQGLLWALNHYWRMVEKDGGLYIECEALVLSRTTPFMLGWAAHPVISKAARESLIRTIHGTLRMMNSPDAVN
jgi:hypothetical protein